MSNLSTIIDVEASRRCEYCSHVYATIENLRRHLRNGCAMNPQEINTEIDSSKRLKPKRTTVSDLAKTIEIQNANQSKIMEQLLAKIEKLEGRPVANINQNSNNNLNVMCLTKNDDFLQLLTLQDGAKKALTFIKNCALARLAGDCRILERIYFPPDKNPALMYANRSRTQFVYYDEKQNRIVEGNPKVVAKILAENIQRSYLKGSQSLRDSDGKPMYVGEDHPFLPVIEEFDMFTWNSHIYELNDEKYQKKVLSSIRIPFEEDILK